MNKSKHQATKERLATAKKLENTSEAIAQIEGILEDCPGFIPAWLELGLAYRKTGDRQSALETFQKVLELDSDRVKARLELASEQLFLNKIEDCRKNLERSIEIDPKNGRTYIRLGKVYQQQNNDLEALELFDKALQIDPTLKEASLNAAGQLRKLERIEEAVEYLEQALQHYPNCYRLLGKIGEMERERQRFEIALAYFQQAIAIEPEQIRSHICQVNILWDLKRFDEAEEYLKFLYDKFPKNFSILILLGQSAKKLERREEALQRFREAHSKASNPDRVLRAVTFEIEELKVLGRLDEALEQVDLAIAQFPENSRLQTIKGNVLQAQVNLSEAAKIYQRILATNPRNLDSRIELAKVYSQSGRVEQAIDLLEETNQLMGANVKTFIQLGSLNQALGNCDLAETWYRKACLEYPKYPLGHCKLANLLFSQGEAEIAIELLQNARAKLAHSPQLVIELIKLQIRLGNFDESERLIRTESKRFLHENAFAWQLYELKIKQGEYAAALDILDRLSTDNQGEINKIEQARANVYFLQYDLLKAEKHIRNAIGLIPFAIPERMRLANILLLTGRVNEAYQELKIATEQRILKNPLGRSVVPLKSIPAVVINLLRIHPLMLEKLIEAERKTASEKILAFGSLLNEEPNYFGSALYLARELRKQGIFAQLQQALSTNPTNVPQIPRRIVQFWDEPEPPLAVQRICQSWSDRNPEYEYQLFSFDMATAFIEEHYDARVSKAFANCDKPATQADFFRLAYLNKMGGFYADADDLCRQPLDSLRDLRPELIVCQETTAVFGNNFLGCIPGQTMIRTALETAVANLTSYSHDSPWATTGPALITSSVCNALVPYLDQRSEQAPSFAGHSPSSCEGRSPSEFASHSEVYPFRETSKLCVGSTTAKLRFVRGVISDCTNYQMWPRLLVLTTAQLKKIVHCHMALPYKATDRSWVHEAYQRSKAVQSVPAKSK